MGKGWRARGQERAREFGARHPRLATVILCAFLAGLIVVCVLQLSYGTYLGRDWLIAALAGMAAATGVSASALISIRRHGDAMSRAGMAWLMLWVASESAIRLPFPQGPYGGVQAFFNVMHAALLGYEAVACTAIVVLLGFLLLRFRSRVRGQAVRVEHVPGRAVLPARLRFTGATTATWRAGRLIAADGTVRWVSRKGDAEVDLTAACQAPAMLSAAAHTRQPRTTTLATASGLAEIDVSPRALAALARSFHHPPSSIR